jgi:uncharacterized protein (DUF302 family)
MDEGDVVTKASPWSVADTVARLSAVLAARGLKLFTLIDHSGEAAAAGLELRDTKLALFGSPEAGALLMASVPLIGLDLPFKMLVWDDGDGTQISYTAPAVLAQRYGLTQELTDRLKGIEALTDAVIAM